MLTTVVIALVAVTALLLILVATRPDTCRVERSVSISAPPERIFPRIASLRSLSTWNPFEAQDPDIRRTYSGPESGPGATLEFVGRKSGKGLIEIVEAAAPSRVAMQLAMLAPIPATNSIEFTLAPQGDHTRVTWSMHGRVPFLAKLFHLVFNAERMVGGQFDAGLAALKAQVEGRPAPAQP